MPFVEWTTDLSVGFTNVDEQHQHFIGLVNDFYNALEVGAQWSIVDDTIAMLLSYAQYHFDSEQALMARYGYPKTEEHLREHRRFIENAARLDLGKRAREETLPLDVFNFLMDWLTDHIAKYDRELAGHLRRCARQA
jgi:hemerythrin-like metal-binding protein